MSFLVFNNILGFLALLSIIPLILLLFIKPKPKDVVVPSIMFLHRNNERKNRRSFFEKIKNDKLLILQIIILGLLSLFFTSPYIETSYGSSDNVIFVVDLSASMGTEEFTNLLDSAREYFGKRNTIIIVNSSPQVLLEGGDSDEAEKVFNSLKVLDGVSDLNSAMILAKNKLAKISEGGKIVVLSDFLETESASFLEKELFFDEKTPIKIIQLKHLAKNNIGVIDLKLDERKGKAFIKNFCCGDKTLGIEYEGQAETLSIPLGGVEEYEFDVPYGTSVLKLRNEDGLNEDNLLYVSKPSETNLKVSLISFNPSKHLVAALSSPNDISLKISSPLDPNVGDHDIYVLQNIGQISKSLRKELGKELEFGKGLIIHVEEGINGNYDSLLDFEIEGNVGGGNSKINYNGPLLEGLEFGKQQKVRNIVCENECGGGLVSINDIPLLMLQSSREGVVGYYGIDEKNGFKNTPNYPLFWNRFLRHVSGVEDIHGTNILTGTVKFVGKDTTYTLPTGAKIKGDQIVFDEVGFYEVDGKTYASNLLNIEESSIHEPVKDYESRGDWEIKSGEIERKSVWKEIILLIILLLIVEWLACNKKVKRCRYYA